MNFEKMTKSELIKELKKQNRKIKKVESETHHLTEDILESISDGCFTLNENMEVTYFNKKAEILLGRKKEEVLRKKLFDSFAEAKGSIFEKNYSKVMKDRSPLSFETYFDKKPYDNWYNVNVYPFKKGISVFFQVTSEYKKVENERKKSEQQLSDILNNSTTVICLKDKDGKYLLINRQYEKLFHIKNDDIKGKSDFEIFPEEIAKKLRENDLNILAEEKPIEFEEEVPHDDGLHSYISIKFPLLDKDGKAYAVCGISTDITQQKNITKKLQEGESRFRDLFDNMTSGVAIYKAVCDGNDFQFVDFNRGGEKIEGVKKEDLIGKNVTKAFPGVIEFGLLDVFKRVWKSGKSEHHPIAFYKDSRVAGWRNNLVYKLSTGEIVAIYDDLTEQKWAEQKLIENEKKHKTILDSASDGIAIAEISKKKFEYVNNKMSKMLGYSKKELKTMGVLDIHPKDDIEFVIAEFEAQGRGEKILARDIPCLKKDGTTFLADINTTAIKLDDKKYNVGFFRDITDRKQMEKDKDDMQKQIFQSSKLASIGLLAAGVGHEINNPLAIIYGYTQRISKNFNDKIPEIKTPLENIKKASDRIKEIVNGLRTFARMDTEHIGGIDVHKSINDTMSLISSIFKADNVIIETLFQAEQSMVKGNIGKLQQVIMNLITNAKEAMSDNGGIIKIETNNLESSIIVKITDNGHGIEKKNIDRIFETFFTTKDIGQGTGLGLWITHSIVIAMNGQIKVDSEIGIGTTFTITWPIFKTDQKIKEENSSIEIKKISGQVLVVEDEEIFRKLLCDDLRDMGLDVDEANNGLNALEKISLKKYDCIITDLKMPHMDGDVLIQEIKKLGGDEKIIVITGGIITDYSAQQRYALRKLANGYLKKPFNQQEVYSILSNIITNK